MMGMMLVGTFSWLRTQKQMLVDMPMVSVYLINR
jgi:hypothetical protein